MKIVFFGTPEFAVASLDTLFQAGYEIAAVVTMPDKVGGRGNKTIESDVKKYATERNLKVLQPEKLRDELFLKELKELEADLFIVIAFRMLPKVVWEMPRLGTFNLHASLLPQLRGAAPINHAIINGFKETGVTTFLINEEIDKGNILLSSSLEIADDEDAGSLHDRLMEIGAKLTLRTVKLLETGEIEPKPQTESGEIFAAPKIFKQDCFIDFARNTDTVHNKVRGLSPYPGGWSGLITADGKEMEVKILKTNKTEDIDFPAASQPGDAFHKGTRLFVKTEDGAIEILTIQPAGKRRMTAEAFLAGHKPTRFC